MFWTRNCEGGSSPTLNKRLPFQRLRYGCCCQALGQEQDGASPISFPECFRKNHPATQIFGSHLPLFQKDETLERRWGRKIAAKGRYRDPVRSTDDQVVMTPNCNG